MIRWNRLQRQLLQLLLLPKTSSSKKSSDPRLIQATQSLTCLKSSETGTVQSSYATTRDRLSISKMLQRLSSHRKSSVLTRSTILAELANLKSQRTLKHSTSCLSSPHNWLKPAPPQHTRAPASMRSSSHWRRHQIRPLMWTLNFKSPRASSALKSSWWPTLKFSTSKTI